MPDNVTTADGNFLSASFERTAGVTDSIHDVTKHVPGFIPFSGVVNSALKAKTHSDLMLSNAAKGNLSQAFNHTGKAVLHILPVVFAEVPFLSVATDYAASRIFGPDKPK